MQDFGLKAPVAKDIQFGDIATPAPARAYDSIKDIQPGHPIRVDTQDEQKGGQLVVSSQADMSCSQLRTSAVKGSFHLYKMQAIVTCF